MSAVPTPKFSGRAPPVFADFGSATHDDLHVSLCRLENLLEIQMILQVSPEAARWSVDALADALRAHAPYFLVVRQDRGIAGFICGRKIASEGEILNLAVRPSFRRRSIGKTLVSKLLRTFAQEGVSQVFLEVRESNASAIAFYQELDFRQIGRRPNYYDNPREAALVLSRQPL
jgi:[ribosomal protein S18]-alanine N-acetyltransferase